MNQKTGKITRLWLTMIHVSDLDKALRFYHETLGLPIALDARIFDHAEVGPDEPLAKIGIHATSKKAKRKDEQG
ncbi:MAG: VOC family protein [Candidatus Bathyarchaeota archaeon]|nr:MAG: VOC family protein [Candidatus Bathyarchaeota archaeon]